MPDNGVNRVFQVFLEHLAVQEQQGTEGLVLGRGSDLLIYGQVGEKGLDLGAAHLVGVPFIVEQDVAPDPVHVRVFGADGVVLEAQGISDTSTKLSTGLIEKLFGCRFHGFSLRKRLD